MSVCVKCNHSIKPASLATHVNGESFHPTCLSCAICSRPLWGREFKKQDKKLVCAEPCRPAQPPQNLSPNDRPSSAAQRQQQQIIIEQQRFQQMQYTQLPPLPGQVSDLNMYRKPTSFDFSQQNKVCRACNQPVEGKRFITYENGEIICQNCEIRPHMAGQLTMAAPANICASCNTSIPSGSRFYTDPNRIVNCENCEVRGQRCAKCSQLFRFNQPRRVMSNGTPYHEHCFTCSLCNAHISTKEFYQNELLQPMCVNCFTDSKLPKCSVCMRPVSGQYLLIDNQPVHHGCFKCNNCGSIINSEQGYFRNKINNMPICTICNGKLYGAKCFRCINVIEKDGITFADHDYHSSCFKCDKCGVELVKMKKTLTDKSGQGLYCEPCHTQVFASKCAKCSNPITANSPGVVYEDKNMHKECFACARCKKTLVGKKFSKNGSIMICEFCN